MYSTLHSATDFTSTLVSLLTWNIMNLLPFLNSIASTFRISIISYALYRTVVVLVLEPSRDPFVPGIGKTRWPPRVW